MLLFIHGNAGNISHRLESIQIFHQLGLDVFIFDYRGYGHSEGKPTEQGTYKDAEAAWRYLIEERQVSPKRSLFLGARSGLRLPHGWLRTTCQGRLSSSQHSPLLVILLPHYIPTCQLGCCCVLNTIQQSTLAE